MAITVYKRDDETEESLIRRFKKKCQNDGILNDLRKYEYYRSPAQKRKEKRENAAKRNRKY